MKPFANLRETLQSNQGVDVKTKQNIKCIFEFVGCTFSSLVNKPLLGTWELVSLWDNEKNEKKIYADSRTTLSLSTTLQ